MVNYNGIVVSIKRAPDPRNNLYTIASTRVINAKSSVLMELCDSVEVDVEDGAITGARILEKSTEEGALARINELSAGLRIGVNAKKAVGAYAGRQYGEALGRMEKPLEKAAAAFAGAYISGAPIIVRFHHDGDGSSGAVSIYRALSKIAESLMEGQRGVSWVMHKGVEYDRESFYSDTLEFRNYESVCKPVVLITDFGTAPGSEAQIAALSESARLIMLDHHPVYDGFPKEKAASYINPWDYGSDTNFTAGLLASIFAEFIYTVDTEDMKAASLISDFSSFGDRSSKEGMRDAVILDYLTNISGRADSSIQKLTPSYIESILMNREKADEVFYTASSAMDEMLDLGVKKAESYSCSSGITAFVLDFGTMPRASSGYPLPGRYSSRLQERLEGMNGKRTVTILYYSGYVTMRVSKEVSKSVGILKMIDEIVESSDYAESGGGHNEAASIKVSREHSKDVVDLVLTKLGASL